MNTEANQADADGLQLLLCVSFLHGRFFLRRWLQHAPGRIWFAAGVQLPQPARATLLEAGTPVLGLLADDLREVPRVLVIVAPHL